jgi:hypothetical protein
MYVGNDYWLMRGNYYGIGS